MYLLKTVNGAYMGRSTPNTAFNGFCFGLVLNVPVNNFSAMLGRIHHFRTFLRGVNMSCSKTQYGDPSGA